MTRKRRGGHGPRLKPTVEVLAEVRRLAGLGLTVDEIGGGLGISRSQFYALKKKYPEIQDALDEGKGQAIKEVTNALYDAAMAGNTTAQIFFLKNRAPDRWRDRKELEHSGQVDVAQFVTGTVAKQMAEDEQPTQH